MRLTARRRMEYVIGLVSPTLRGRRLMIHGQSGRGAVCIRRDAGSRGPVTGILDSFCGLEGVGRLRKPSRHFTGIQEGVGRFGRGWKGPRST